MNKDYVNYALTKELHDLEYSETTMLWIDDEDDIINDSSAVLIGALSGILWQSAFRWFREKHGMLCSIEFVEPEYGGEYGYKLYYKPGHLHIDHWGKGYKTYEEAELACIKQLIKIVKEKL